MEGLHLVHFPISGSVQMQAVFEAHATKAQAQAAGELHFARAVRRTVPYAESVTRTALLLLLVLLLLVLLLHSPAFSDHPCEAP